MGRTSPAGRPARPRLKQLEFEFEERLTAEFSSRDKMLWVYYFPFLYCYGKTEGRRILYTAAHDSHFLFLERASERGTQLDLVVPPIPLTREAVEFARFVVSMRRRPRPGRILWVDEEDAPRLADWGLEIVEKEKEYIIDPARIVGPGARLPKRLRKKLRMAAEVPLSAVPFESCHRRAALELLDGLAEKEEYAGLPPLDLDYTVECVKRSPKLIERGMIGLAACFEDNLVGFAFGGPMTPRVANFFILKTDPDVPGLAEWLRVQFLRRVAAFSLVNDASDLGNPGLAQHKRQFLPVRMLPAFTVRRLD